MDTGAAAVPAKAGITLSLAGQREMPMRPICLHDKTTIESLLRKNTELHIYAIGDLDDFFWPYTTWYALPADNEFEAMVLLYTGQELPTLVALSEQPGVTAKLLESILHLLPVRFYAHLSQGLEDVFHRTHSLDSHGEHYKMALHHRGYVDDLRCGDVLRLDGSDLDELYRLYQDSYPGNWFEPRMLETNQYFGIRRQGQLVSAAGVHVYSESYRVAALGNIATHPAYRRRGYGKLVTARLCQSLLEKVDHIGLNVKVDNEAAVCCYQKLGFEIVASYGEFMIQLRS
jgi:GNAT superfamily N-acetyltransferase